MPLPLTGASAMARGWPRRSGETATGCGQGSGPAGRGEDSLAVLHLLEAERVARQAVSRHATARRLLTALLARERRAATPGLRALAARAGLL